MAEPRRGAGRSAGAAGARHLDRRRRAARRGLAARLGGPRRAGDRRLPGADQELFGFAGHVPLEIGGRPHPVRDAGAVRALRGAARPTSCTRTACGPAASPGWPGRAGPLVVTWHNAQLVAAGAAGAAAGAAGRPPGRRHARGLGGPRATGPARLGGRDVRLAPVAAPALLPTGRDPGLGRPLVLAVGRLHPQKGYDVAARRAAARCGAPSSPSPATARWRPSCGPPGAAGALARPPRRRRPTCWPPPTSSCCRRVWEARSLTAQEALRAGRPLVATAVGGLPDLVGDGALLVPPGDPAALGRRGARPAGRPGRRGGPGRAGRARSRRAGRPRTTPPPRSPPSTRSCCGDRRGDRRVPACWSRALRSRPARRALLAGLTGLAGQAGAATPPTPPDGRRRRRRRAALVRRRPAHARPAGAGRGPAPSARCR